MAKTTVAVRNRVGAGSSTIAIVTASLFIALATALSFAPDESDDARGLHLRGSLATGDAGAASVPLQASSKHV